MLLLHAGAEPIDYDGLRGLHTPEATASHVPVPHYRLVDMLRHTLSFYGHDVVSENHAVTASGDRYFGLLALKSTWGDYQDTVIVRNSHDKKFPIGFGFGGHVFCCDNLSFIAEHVIKRRHTLNAKRDLPALVGQIVEPLAEQREAQQRTFLRYKAQELTEALCDHAIMRMYRGGVLNITRVPDVLEEWENPPFAEWGDRTAYRLFNAVTHVLEGKIAEGTATRDLHSIIDGVCT